MKARAETLLLDASGLTLHMDASTSKALEVVAAELERLLQEATSDVIRAKLQNLNDVCQRLVVSGKQRLTVPDVVAAYAARIHSPSQSLAESSIRNKRGGDNPYHKLYATWQSASWSIQASKRQGKPKYNIEEIISQEDVSAISDDVVRHQVSLLLAQNRSYKSQLEILKQVRGSPVVKLVREGIGADQTVTKVFSLTEAEIEAIKDFTAKSKLAVRLLRSTSDGGLETTDGRRLADPGFMDALRKVLENCNQSNR